MPSGTKPLHESMLTQVLCLHMASLGTNELKSVSMRVVDSIQALCRENKMSWILFNINQVNGPMPNSTKSLPEWILTYSQWDLWDETLKFEMKYITFLSGKCTWKCQQFCSGLIVLNIFSFNRCHSIIMNAMEKTNLMSCKISSQIIISNMLIPEWNG